MVTTLRLPLPHGLHGFFRPRSPPPWPAWSPGSRRCARLPCALTISLSTEEVERRLAPTALHLPVPLASSAVAPIMAGLFPSRAQLDPHSEVRRSPVFGFPLHNLPLLQSRKQ
jgi:hypothetical protein